MGPYGAAGSRREPLIAGLCITLILAIFLLEVSTPDDYVLIDLALLPLLAAMWLLSAPMAAVVAFVAGILFLAELATDSANRITLIFLGITMFGTAFLARIYATNLATIFLKGRRIPKRIAFLEETSLFQKTDTPSGGLRSLTRRELEVARLAAQGLTSREIGGQLSIGARTVETHLASAYSKLRIRSRAELVRMAPRLAGES
jgi:DNA-binding CsgD family transcriptional regulator